MADSQAWLRGREDDLRFSEDSDEEYCEECGEIVENCECPIGDDDDDKTEEEEQSYQEFDAWSETLPANNLPKEE